MPRYRGVYVYFNNFGQEQDVTREIQDYLDKIVRLEKENADLKKKLAEKPKGKVVKKYE